MPRRLPRITVVRRGVAVRRLADVLPTARWWVVRVRNAASQSKCWIVYGGEAATVRACLAQHATYEPVTDVVVYPFDDSQASLAFRARIEEKYMAPAPAKAGARCAA